MDENQLDSGMLVSFSENDGEKIAYEPPHKSEKISFRKTSLTIGGINENFRDNHTNEKKKPKTYPLSSIIKKRPSSSPSFLNEDEEKITYKTPPQKSEKTSSSRRTSSLNIIETNENFRDTDITNEEKPKTYSLCSSSIIQNRPSFPSFVSIMENRPSSPSFVSIMENRPSSPSYFSRSPSPQFSDSEFYDLSNKNNEDDDLMKPAVSPPAPEETLEPMLPQEKLEFLAQSSFLQKHGVKECFGGGYVPSVDTGAFFDIMNSVKNSSTTDIDNLSPGGTILTKEKLDKYYFSSEEESSNLDFVDLLKDDEDDNINNSIEEKWFSTTTTDLNSSHKSSNKSKQLISSNPSVENISEKNVNEDAKKNIYTAPEYYLPPSPKTFKIQNPNVKLPLNFRSLGKNITNQVISPQPPSEFKMKNDHVYNNHHVEFDFQTSPTSAQMCFQVESKKVF